MKIRTILFKSARIVLACVFIFSGFVKAVDPWGGAIKFGEYFAAFGVDWVGERLCFVLSIGLSTLEMGLGLMLIFGLWLRLASVVTFVFMTFFTLFTFYIALKNPVADCGCFGEVWKITNWQTFAKNALILLPMSGLMWYDVRLRQVKDSRNVRNFLLVVLVTLVPAFVSIWSLTHLPLVDFMSYRVGTNLRAEQSVDSTAEQVETELIYRDKTTGKEHVFLLSDTTWYDESRWEYVDTKVLTSGNQTHSPLYFSLFNALGDDVTHEIFEQKHVYLLCISDLNIGLNQEVKLQQFVARVTSQSDSQVVVVTPASISDKALKQFDCPYFNIDATALKTLIRAKVGVVELRDGVIVRKVNWRDINKL